MGKPIVINQSGDVKREHSEKKTTGNPHKEYFEPMHAQTPEDKKGVEEFLVSQDLLLTGNKLEINSKSGYMERMTEFFFFFN